MAPWDRRSHDISGVVTRTSWGAREPIWSRGISYYNTEIETLRQALWRVVVHHSDNDADVSENERRQRDGILGPHLSPHVASVTRGRIPGGGYACLAYHLFISPNGRTYEGRPLEIVGGHAGSFGEANEDITRDPDFGPVGICLQGNYHGSRNDNRWVHQRVTLRFLLLTLRRMFGIGQVWMHREVLSDLRLPSTDCPGQYLADRITGLREELGMVPRVGLAASLVPAVSGVPTTSSGLNGTGLAAFGGQALRLGSRGEGVRRMQAMLGMPPADQDGVFGPRTAAALGRFQQGNGLRSNGILGPQSSDRLIRGFQRSRGLVDDGVVGPLTRAGHRARSTRCGVGRRDGDVESVVLADAVARWREPPGGVAG